MQKGRGWGRGRRILSPLLPEPDDEGNNVPGLTTMAQINQETPSLPNSIQIDENKNICPSADCPLPEGVDGERLAAEEISLAPVHQTATANTQVASSIEEPEVPHLYWASCKADIKIVLAKDPTEKKRVIVNVADPDYIHKPQPKDTAVVLTLVLPSQDEVDLAKKEDKDALQVKVNRILSCQSAPPLVPLRPCSWKIYPFTSLPVEPRVRELFSTQCNTVRPNLLKGAYSSEEHYLDVHFRLLREDFLRSVKAGLQAYLNGKPLTNGIRVHDTIQLIGVTEGLFYEIQLPHALVQEIKKDTNKRFLPGSLLLLTNNSFQTTCVVRISGSDGTLEETKGSLIVTCQGSPIHLVPGQAGLLTVECETYFQPYGSVMKSLKAIKWLDTITIGRIILNGGGPVTLPAYLKQKTLHIGSAIVKPEDVSTWPSAETLSLDDAQYTAYRAALTQEFVMIQGPPGTGKTYLGLQVIKTLLQKNNRNLWKDNHGGPIFVVSYTNHALDQFGEGILDMFTPEEERCNGAAYRVQYPKIYRVGMGCQSDRLCYYSAPANWEPETVDVVLMTTSGASMRLQQLLKMQSRILIVEEAAEILESHIVACLTRSIEHVILLGDHKQLRPITATDEMSLNFHLDVSLFERMVNNDFPRYQLQVQHRMRPEIRNLITDTIYSNLRDHSKVENYPNVSGMLHNLFFVDHRLSETSHKGENLSKSNEHEAKFLAALCAYLLRKGHPAKSITILALYMAQVNLLQTEVRENRGITRDVRIETADSFQGEENDIILLSLVRSNTDNSIGFMKTDNRICVALSRAKHGLYIIGNMELLSNNSSTWQVIRTKLEDAGLIGPKLTLVCNEHDGPELSMPVATPADFMYVQTNGCFFCREESFAARNKRRIQSTANLRAARSGGDECKKLSAEFMTAAQKEPFEFE